MPYSIRLAKGFKLFIVLLNLCFGSVAFAQVEKARTDVYVYSAETNLPLAYATVSVLKQEDSAHVAFSLTDKEGYTWFDGLKTGVPYNLLVYYMGYDVGRVPITLTKDTILDTIFLARSDLTIDQIVVMAERPPLIIKNDTMEFNASAFKTLPDALVEDLLNKLPGVEKDENGDLMVNGKKVTKLTVDGKVFFGADPAIALKNLPANAIEKIQITTDDEYKNENNPTGESDETVVINLTIKKGMKKGYFGKVYAGGGISPPDRMLYETGGIINMFRDTFQVSIIGFGNNTNKQAFNFQELSSIGGFDRSGVDQWSNSGTGVQIGNVSIGGATEGFNQASGGGININHNLERSYFNFQYFYGGNIGKVRQDGNVIQSFSDSVMFRNNTGNNQSAMNSHRLGMQWELNLDTLTNIEFSAHSSLYTENDRDELFSEASFGERFVNSNDKTTDHLYQNLRFGGSGSVNRLSANQKWNSYLSIEVNRSFQTQDDFSTTLFRFIDVTLQDSTQEQQRLMDRKEDDMEIYASTTYDIKDSLKLRFTYNGVYTDVGNLNETYNKSFSSEAIDSSLSNKIESISFRHDLSLALTFVLPKLSVTPFINVIKYDMENAYAFGKAQSVIHDLKLFPGINIRAGEFRIAYQIEYNAPDIWDLNPVLDNSSISSQSAGNPNLKSELSHNVNIYTNHYNPKTLLYYYLYLNARSYGTAIANEQKILENGVYFRSPVNVSGKQSFYGGGTIRKSWNYENKNTLSLSFSTWSDVSRSPIVIDNKQFTFTSLNVRPIGVIELNMKDILEISQIFSYRYRSNQQAEDARTVGNTYTSSTALIFRYPVRFMWRVSYDFNYTAFNTNNVPVNEYYLLNAELFFNVDKKGKWQLNFKAYDILKQNQNVSTYSSDNFVYFSRSNVLQRYFLLTLVYNVNTFQGSKVNSRDRSFWWW